MNQSRKFLVMAAAVVTVLIGASSGEALQYDRIALPSGPKVLVLARGHIDQGDTQRLFNFLIALPTSDRIAGLVVDSPGGGLVEAEALAGVIRRAAFPIFVPPGGQCSSACFLLFAAAPRRFVADDARIGVHRPSDNGRETSASKIATAAMAKDAGELGVPQNIVWKLVQTPPERKAWLSQADFAAMGVSVVEGARRTGMTAASGDKTTDRGTIEAWLMMLNAH